MIRLEDQQAAQIAELLRETPGDAAAAARTTILGQLERPSWAGDLIEQVAGWLKRPNARGILGGEILATLRSKLLSPRELAEVTNAIAKGLACSNCGKTVVRREIASVSGQDIMCARCYMPSTVRCQCGCQLDVDLKAKLSRAMRECKQCKLIAAGKAPAPPAEPDVPQVNQLPNLGEALRAGAGQAGRAFARAPFPPINRERERQRERERRAAEQVNRAGVQWRAFLDQDGAQVAPANAAAPARPMPPMGPPEPNLQIGVPIGIQAFETIRVLLRDAWNDGRPTRNVLLEGMLIDIAPNGLVTRALGDVPPAVERVANDVQVNEANPFDGRMGDVDRPPDVAPLVDIDFGRPAAEGDPLGEEADRG